MDARRLRHERRRPDTEDYLDYHDRLDRIYRSTTLFLHSQAPQKSKNHMKTEPNQSLQTTIMAVTDRAPSSTLRASHDRVLSQTLGKEEPRDASA